MIQEENKISEKELSEIRQFLIDKIFRNSDVMYNREIRSAARHTIKIANDDVKMCVDLAAVVAFLYNKLHYAVTGEVYEYFFHWANKCGADVEDVKTIEETEEEFDSEFWECLGQISWWEE